MRTLHINSHNELRQVDHRAVIAWERIMREIDEAEPSTVRRRLAALSSLFKHLKRHHHVESNPVAEVERPAINRREGSTHAFSKADAAKLLNITPTQDTVEGLRDRAILSVVLQVGLRRAEIAALFVEDLHQNRGFDSLRIVRKGGRRDALAIHPNTAQRIRAYLDAAGHADDLDGPIFRPLSHNRKRQESRRHMDPDAHRVLRKHALAIGPDAWLFGAFHARDRYRYGTGKRLDTGLRSARGRTRRARYHQALRPAGVPLPSTTSPARPLKRFSLKR